MASPTQLNSSAAQAWSNEDLLRIIRKQEWKQVPALHLKGGDVLIQLVQSGKQFLVEKRYQGRLAHFAKRELDYFNKVNYHGMERVNLLRSMETTQSTVLNETVVRTQWCGLDTRNWAQLLKANRGRNGEDQAQYCFTNKAAVVLAWVRGVLRSIQPFHQDGFVHCDLLARNIVIPCTPIAGESHQFELQLDTPYIIDLELCLGPQTSDMNKWGSALVRDGFFDNTGTPLPLNPQDRSEYLCSGTIHKQKTDAMDTMARGSQQGRQYIYVAGKRKLHKEPFANLELVDWGVDLFSLGIAVREMIRDTELSGTKPVLDYLYELPNQLRGYEALCKKGKPRTDLPHAALIKKIDSLIGEDFYKTFKVTVPPDYQSDTPILEDPAYFFTEQHQSGAGLNSKRTMGMVGSLAIGLMVGGGIWSQWNKEKEPLPPPQESAPLPAPTREVLYQQATTKIAQSKWHQGKAKPTETELQWVRDTQALAKNGLPSAQYQLAGLYCSGIAEPAVAYDTALCGKWLSQVLIATPTVAAEQANDYRDTAIRYFGQYVVSAPQPDAAFARALQPGLEAWHNASPNMALALAEVVGCYQKPPDLNKARQLLSDIVTKNPTSQSGEAAKVLLGRIESDNRFPCQNPL